MLSVLFGILILVLRIYSALLWGRLILEWVRVFKPGFRPRGILLFLFEAVYTATDLVVVPLRKALPPIRLGAVALDVSLLVAIFGISIITSLLGVLAFQLS